VRPAITYPTAQTGHQKTSEEWLWIFNSRSGSGFTGSDGGN